MAAIAGSTSINKQHYNYNFRPHITIFLLLHLFVLLSFTMEFSVVVRSVNAVAKKIRKWKQKKNNRKIYIACRVIRFKLIYTIHTILQIHHLKLSKKKEEKPKLLYSYFGTGILSHTLFPQLGG